MIGKKIKKLREKLGINQTDFGLLINLKQPDVSKIENGDTKSIDAELLYKISNALNVSMESFFDSEEETYKISKSKISGLSPEQKTSIILKILEIIQG